ncbi:Hypothetical protein POVN_LOCUS574 [uncultured virus]|nr:Hypothetical protein POVN_LOCUS574 [uncultured virus]
MARLYNVDEWRRLPPTELKGYVNEYVGSVATDDPNQLAALMVQAVMLNIPVNTPKYRALERQSGNLPFDNLVLYATEYLTQKPSAGAIAGALRALAAPKSPPRVIAKPASPKREAALPLPSPRARPDAPRDPLPPAAPIGFPVRNVPVEAKVRFTALFDPRAWEQLPSATVHDLAELYANNYDARYTDTQLRNLLYRLVSMYVAEGTQAAVDLSGKAYTTFAELVQDAARYITGKAAIQGTFPVAQLPAAARPVLPALPAAALERLPLPDVAMEKPELPRLGSPQARFALPLPGEPPAMPVMPGARPQIGGPLPLPPLRGAGVLPFPGFGKAPLELPGLGDIIPLPAMPSKSTQIPRHLYNRAGLQYATVVDYLRDRDVKPNMEILRKLLQTKPYGTFDAMDILYIYQIPQLDVMKMSTAVIEPALAVDQLLDRFGKELKELSAREAALTAALAKGEDGKGLPGVQFFKGLPYVVLQTGAFSGASGFMGAKIPPARYVQEVGGVAVAVWSELYVHAPFLRNNARKISSLLSRFDANRIGVMRSASNARPTTELGLMVNNLPELLSQALNVPITDAARIEATIGLYKVPRDISLGAKQALFRLLGRNHTYYESLPIPSNLPVYIEDFIPEKDWKEFIPAFITRTVGPVKVVENPYELIPDIKVLAMCNERDVHLEFEQARAGLYTLDKADPTWMNATLALRDFNAMTYDRAYYWLAARGITFPYYEANVVGRLGPTYAVVAQVFDSGGLGATKEEALPTESNFMQQEVRTLSAPQIELVCRTFNIPDFELVTPDVLQAIIVRGYINPLPLPKRISDRHEIWKKLTPLHKKMLNNLYARTVDVIFFCNVERPPLIEQYILAYAEEYLDYMVQALGMVVPRGTTKADYVTGSLHLYNPLLERKKTDTDKEVELRDSELLDRLEAVVPYASRAELLEQFQFLARGGTGFFVPTERRCKNTTTLDYTGETSDKDIFLLGYGTLTDYYCYKISEVSAGFYGMGTTEDVFKYQIPSATQVRGYTPITKEAAHQVRKLVSVYLPELKGEELDDAKTLLVNIQRMDDIFEKGSVYDAEVHKVFVKLPLTARPLISQLLYQIFYLGMYARRWKGPPNPYPLIDKETWMDQCFIPEVATREPLTLILATMAALEKESKEALAFVEALRVVEHRDGAINQSSATTFAETFSLQYGARRGHTCIRIGSTILIGTGHYYLDLFFKEKIRDYDPLKIQKII